MSFEERAALRAALTRHCKVPKLLSQVVNMVRRDAPALIDESTEELVLDVDAVESRILWQWKASVDGWARAAPPKKKARIRAVVRHAAPALPPAAAPPPPPPVPPTTAALVSGGGCPTESPGHESETTIQDACIQDGGIVLHTGSCSDATATYDDDSLSDSDSISDSD